MTVMQSKPRIILPMISRTYYGTSISIENIEKGLKLFIGEHNRVEEMIVEEVKFDKNLNSYEIHTDKAILLAYANTRVSYSVSYRQQNPASIA